MINIKAYKAQEGDAFLLSFGENQDFNLIIDMGLEPTYFDSIKPDLQSLHLKDKRIDLLVITHVDIDHINGAISFITENDSDKKVIDVNEIWHNTYRHLQFDKEKVTTIPRAERSELENLILRNTNNIISDGISDVKVKQGISFGSLILKHNYNWNTAFLGKAVCCQNKLTSISPEINFIILSPNTQKLNILAKKWLSDLENILYDFKISDEEIFDDCYEFCLKNEKNFDSKISDASYSRGINIDSLRALNETDGSITNGSSISFIIEYDHKKLLFLSDSHEDIIFDNLLKLKMNSYDLNFELTKISHHGSNKNISNRLLELFESKKFLITTNGAKHNHPDTAAIIKIITKPSNYRKEIIFNYVHTKLVPLFSDEMKEKYNFDIIYTNEVTIK